MTEEGNRKKEIEKAVSRGPRRVFNNPVGEGWVGDAVQVKGTARFSMLIQSARRIIFGLIPGSGDLIGWETIVITPEMVGQKIARFLSIEVKVPGKYARANQRIWRAIVTAAGGRAIVARSGPDALEQLNGEKGEGK